VRFPGLLFARWLIAGWLIALMIPGPISASDTEEPTRGFDALAYHFDLELRDDTDRIDVTTYVELVATRSLATIELDLVGGANGGVPSGMVVSGVGIAMSEPGVTDDRRTYDALDFEPATARHYNNSLAIDLQQKLPAGREAIVRVDYAGVPSDGLIIGRNRYRDRTFFGDNYPNRARHWLATVDHPGDKALCGFSVTAPLHYSVVACGHRIEESDLTDGRKRTVWQSDVPIPTKVMTMGAARFAIESLEPVDGIAVETWVYPQDRDKGFRDFAPTPGILRFFVERLGPYPYEKMYSVQSTTRYGGMENAGNIFYGEGVVSGAGKRESLIAHELAHQWFGDSVSEAAWPHVWLSEGFATYGSALYLEHRDGRGGLRKTMQKAREDVEAYAVKSPSEAIVERDLGSLSKLLTPNTYEKGAWVLHMLRREVGDDAFWQILSTFYSRYRDRNAYTSDFVAVVQQVAGRDLSWFFDQWLERPGLPTVTGSFESLDGRVQVEIAQDLTGSYPGPEQEPFRFTLEMELFDPRGDSLGVETVEIERAAETFSFHTPEPVARIVLDPDTWLLASGLVGKDLPRK
jgi:aminopeptidase N